MREEQVKAWHQASTTLAEVCDQCQPQLAALLNDIKYMLDEAVLQRMEARQMRMAANAQSQVQQAIMRRNTSTMTMGGLGDSRRASLAGGNPRRQSRAFRRPSAVSSHEPVSSTLKFTLDDAARAVQGVIKQADVVADTYKALKAEQVRLGQRRVHRGWTAIRRAIHLKQKKSGLRQLLAFRRRHMAERVALLKAMEHIARSKAAAQQSATGGDNCSNDDDDKGNVGDNGIGENNNNSSSRSSAQRDAMEQPHASASVASRTPVNPAQASSSKSQVVSNASNDAAAAHPPTTTSTASPSKTPPADTGGHQDGHPQTHNQRARKPGRVHYDPDMQVQRDATANNRGDGGAHGNTSADAHHGNGGTSNNNNKSSNTNDNSRGTGTGTTKQLHRGGADGIRATRRGTGSSAKRAAAQGTTGRAGMRTLAGTTAHPSAHAARAEEATPVPITSREGSGKEVHGSRQLPAYMGLKVTRELLLKTREALREFEQQRDGVMTRDELTERRKALGAAEKESREAQAVAEELQAKAAQLRLYLERHQSTENKADRVGIDERASLLLRSISKFESLVTRDRIADAALLATTAPDGILRTQATWQRFLSMRGGTVWSIYCRMLLVHSPTDDEVVMCVQEAINRNALSLTAHWFTSGLLQPSLSVAHVLAQFVDETEDTKLKREAAVLSLSLLPADTKPTLDALLIVQTNMIALKRFDAALGMLRNAACSEDDQYVLTQRLVEHPQVPRRMVTRALRSLSVDLTERVTEAVRELGKNSRSAVGP